MSPLAPWSGPSLAPATRGSAVDLLSGVLSGLRAGPSARDAAERVVGRWPDLRRAAHVSERTLRAAGGLSPAQACRLRSALRLAHWMAAAPSPDLRRLTSPAEAADLVRGLGTGRVERFWTLALGPGGEVLGIREVARGSVASCRVSPRDIFSFLLDADAHRGIVAHNHPSGSPEPSEADRLLTRGLASLGAMLGVPIVDHIVVCRRGYVSMSAEGLLPGPGEAGP